jgi:MYXO-CTERM domain-containing protein
VVRVKRPRLAPGLAGGRGCWLAAALAALTLAPRAARANGAFPDSQGILVPAARPDEITLVTNFGLVVSSDGGRSWLWSCEQTANSLGYLYQYGPAPRNRLYALANETLIRSDDNACGWQAATGMVTGKGLTDFFPDPSNPDRVLAAGFDYTTFNYAVYASHDGGATFDVALYDSGVRNKIDGIEIARSDPHTIYASTSLVATGGPALAHSSDDGAHWQSVDLLATLGAGTLRIIAVDPGDAQRVLLLFQGTSQQKLALTRDGGKTVTVSLDPGASNAFTSYARTAAGTILIGGVNVATDPVLYRSHDAGVTFTLATQAQPRVRGLAARGNDVYAATDNFGDGYALGITSDEGATWRPLMSYDRVSAIVGCLKSACQMVCDQEAVLDLWPAAVCSADAPAPPGDGGTDARGADGPVDAGGGGAGGSGRPPSHGGGCAVAPGAPAPGVAWAVLAALLAARRRRKN